MRTRTLRFLLPAVAWLFVHLSASAQPDQKWVADLAGRKIEWLKRTPNKRVLLAGAFVALAAEGIELFSRRFKATQSSANYTFMLTKEGKDIKVLKLATTDGSRENELAFRDRRPVYRYDPNREQLYYRTENSVITCYEF
ncbi:MAG: hypothetical protein WBA12_01415 [Catalinimonas sp.]